MPSPILDRSPHSSPIWAKLTIIPIVTGLFKAGVFLLESPNRMQDYVDRKGWFLTQEEFYFLKEYKEKIWILTPEEKDFLYKLDSFKISGAKSILLKDLTNFDWDEVCFLGPYDQRLDEASADPPKFRGYLLNRKSQYSFDDGSVSLIFLDSKNQKGIVFILRRDSKIQIDLKKLGCKEKIKTFVRIGSTGNFDIIFNEGNLK